MEGAMRRCMIGELKTMMPSTCVGMNEGGTLQLIIATSL